MPISKKRAKVSRIQKAVRKMIEGKSKDEQYNVKLRYWIGRPKKQ